MHTCLHREVWLGMDMLPGLLLTPARQDGRGRERADPQINASMHRFHRKGDEVCWLTDLGRLWFLGRAVRELGLCTHTTFARASFFISFMFTWSICVAPNR
eukprot:4172943-Pleurochrysis_carterae.AAC.1